MNRSTRLRGWLITLVAVALSTVFAITAAELLVRATWMPAKAPAPRPLPEELRDLPRLKGVFALVKPNQRGVYGGVLHETNSAGFRGREYSRDKPVNIFRIVIIGDSITMGQGVDADAPYSAVLERMLNERRDDRTFEVLNLGVAGFDIRASVGTRLKHLGAQFAPDLIVYGFTLNDIEGPAYRRSVRARRLDAGDTTGLKLWSLIKMRWRYLHELLDPAPGSYVYELDENYFRNPQAWEKILVGLDGLSGFGTSIQACAVLLVHTRMHALNLLHPYHRHYQAVLDAARKRGIFGIDSSHAFLGREAKELWVRPGDPHPNSRAHEIFAEVLWEGLSKLPDRCWARRSGPNAEDRE